MMTKKKSPEAARIGVALIVQNESETIERSFRSYYDYVDTIVVSTDTTRGWSGTPVTPDDTLNKISRMDVDRKVTIIKGDYCKYDDREKNDTYQREETANALRQRHPNLDWILQIDADEEFLDFSYVLRTLRSHPFAKVVHWHWISLFNILDDGRLLTVTDSDGKPHLERFPLAYRPHLSLRVCRVPEINRTTALGIVKIQYDGGFRFDKAALHYSYAKSPAKIQEKLQTFGHSHQFDAEKFFALWQSSKTDWENITNFHPLQPHHWPALRAYTPDELRKFTSTKRG